MADQRKEALAGIGITVAVAGAAGGLAMTGYINPSLGWVFFVLGIGAAALIAVRTWLPNTLRLRFVRSIAARRRPAATPRNVELATEGSPLDDTEILARLMIEQYGEDGAKAMMKRAQNRRRDRDAKDDDEPIPVPVVTQKIRREPNRADRYLRRLGFVDFSHLAQKVFDPGLQQMAEANRAADSFAEAARRLSPDFGEMMRQQMPNFGELARQQMPSFSDLAKEEDPQITDLIKDDEED